MSRCAPGDTLYLPRGWLHEALTSDTDSLHITVGVNVYTWLDALRAALDELADDVAFRALAPDDGGSRPTCSSGSPRGSTPDDVARRRARRFVDTRRPILDGQLDELRALGSSTSRRSSSGGRR